MTVDLESELQRLARGWDEAAPPISVAEVTARIAGSVEPDTAPRSGRRWWIPMTGAAAVLAVLVGGLLVIRNDSVTAPTVATVGPAPQPVPTSAPLPGSTSSPDPSTVTSPVPTSVEPSDEPPGGMDPDLFDVFERRTIALRALPGVRLAVSSSYSYRLPDGTMATDEARSQSYEVTMLADGRLWAAGDEDAIYEWLTFDPDGGVLRGRVRPADAAPMEVEITGIGWSTDSTPYQLGLIFPRSPFEGISAPPDDVTIESVEWRGRPATRVTSETSGDDVGSPGTTWTTESIVDDESGVLVLRASSTLSDTGEVTLDERVEITDLEIVDRPPASPPGTFTDEARVLRRQETNGALHVDLDDAADAHGPGFVVPSEALADGHASVQVGSIWLSGLVTDEADTGGPPREATSIEVMWWFGSAFAPERVTLLKTVLDDGPPPEGWLEVGDGLCIAGPGTSCDARYTDGVLADGALAGYPFDLADQFGTSTMSVLGPSGMVLIEAATPEQLEKRANGFVTWPPSS